MKQTRLMMDMPITIEIADPAAHEGAAEPAFAFFAWVDATFSPYRSNSEISQINDGRLTLAQASEPMRAIFQLAEETREDTRGYFDIRRGERFEPSGIVKGWAIHNASLLLRNVTSAPVMVALVGSLTVPCKVPRNSCPKAAVESNRKRVSFMDNPLYGAGIISQRTGVRRMAWTRCVLSIHYRAGWPPIVCHASNPPVKLAMSRNPARRRILVAIELRYPPLQCTT